AGLDAALQGYPFEAWALAGPELLRLSAGALEALGVRRLGHQELLLEAVEQLRALEQELASTSLRTLTERLRALADRAQGLARDGRHVGDTVPPPPPSLELLACVAELLGAAKGLFSWLNRYLFSTLNDYSSSRDIVSLCVELVEALQEDCPLEERESRILPICQHIAGICASIVRCSPAALLERTAVLQRVVLAPALPDAPLPRAPQDLPITSTSSGLHFISGTAPQALAVHGPPLLPGDEIVQIDEQVVVGWTPVNLARKLWERPSGATLVLKKLPPSPPGSPRAAGPPVSAPGAPSTTVSPRGTPAAVTPCPAGSSSGGRGACQHPERRRGVSPPRVPLPRSAAADWESGPDSAPDPTTDEEDERNCSLLGSALRELPHGLLGDGRSSGKGSRSGGSFSLGMWLHVAERGWRWSAPGSLPQVPRRRCRQRPGAARAALRPQRGAPGARDGCRVTAGGSAGVATRLSRRRVSCRDLGRVDCDGWLLKKKDHAAFMAQRWKRCWFVLKGPSLYWYNHPNDDKAAGLINVATYDLESTREQKKKYVFQLSHETYKPFIFAAETLADLSMWVSHLITAKTNHTLAQQPVPHREEDCYSETEAEDPDEDSPRQGGDALRSSPCRPRGTRVRASPPALRAAVRPPLWVHDTGQGCAGGRPHAAVTPPPSRRADPAGEDLESLMQCLKQGGVSLIGRQRFLTEEQCRKSFIRRNKNPLVNEKVHRVRALQSTLKAKLAELQALEQLLGAGALSSAAFASWKDEHRELYEELRESWTRRQGRDEAGAPGAETGPLPGAAEP
ncbi:CNKR1 kinase, partial [Eudromia elegans]|nr:CNKR1 kinase [Eudromia elegans]